MDRHDDDGCTTAAAEATGVERDASAKKKTLRFIALLSFFSFFYSCFSGFSSWNNYNIQFSTLIFSLFAHAMDRKYMFLICNGIVAFLAKTLSFSSSSEFISTAEDSVNQIGQMPATISVQENAAAVEYDTTNTVAGEEEEEEEEEEREKQQECSYRAVSEGDEDMMAEDEVEEEEAEVEVEENKGQDEGTSAVEEVNDASVSTEELNHKFEEFIRKMKEELRIEAQQQQLVTV